MNNIKKVSEVRGNRINCPNFQICPICFGCRAFDSRDPECLICFEEGDIGGRRNFNVCDKKTHRDDLVNKMITKTVYKVDEPINFNNYGGSE